MHIYVQIRTFLSNLRPKFWTFMYNHYILCLCCFYRLTDIANENKELVIM